MAGYPERRLRRLRFNKSIRDLVAETRLSSSDFILPVFVSDYGKRPTEIPEMPGILRYPVESGQLLTHLINALDLGVKAFLIFGITGNKTRLGASAYDSNGVVQRAVKLVRKEIGWDLVIFTDLCLCGYTDHGHCGIPTETARGVIIDNDSALRIYRKIAVSHAEAGTDFVAPSGMMDGQVKAIREALDSQGFTNVGIMSYAVKYASGFYGPFRSAAESAPRFGDRRSYQMDPRNVMEAVREAIMDVDEGADIIMVKPALAYLDVIRLVKQSLPHIPLAAYNVSGEYTMVKLASSKGVIDEKTVTLEILYAIKRAGADMIITYHALDAANWLMKGPPF